MSDQPTPVSPTERSIATLTFPSQARTPLCFPLTQESSVLRQILGMLLYSLLMALSITGSSLLFINVFTPPYGPILSVFLSIFLLPVLILPASTLLCGALFGSWRGTLVSFLSLGGGLLLLHLLNHTPQDLQESLTALILALVATFVVGLIYDRRKYVNGAASFFTMLLGGFIAFCGFIIFLTPDTVESGAFIGCVCFWFMGFGVIGMVGIEVMLQQFLSSRKQKRETDHT